MRYDALYEPSAVGQIMTASELLGVKRKQFARLKSIEFARFLDQIADGTADYEIKRYLVPLFFKIYEMYLENLYLTKSQACRYVPLKHALSCQKYLAGARDRGYINFQPHESDKRKLIIKPGPALIHYVEQEIDRVIDATYAVVDHIERNASGPLTRG